MRLTVLLQNLLTKVREWLAAGAAEQLDLPPVSRYLRLLVSGAAPLRGGGRQSGPQRHSCVTRGGPARQRRRATQGATTGVSFDAQSDMDSRDTRAAQGPLVAASPVAASRPPIHYS